MLQLLNTFAIVLEKDHLFFGILWPTGFSSETVQQHGHFVLSRQEVSVFKAQSYIS